jgi:hypothetical protein
LVRTFLDAGDALKSIERRSLADLHLAPDAVLREMVPVWAEDLDLRIERDGIYRCSEAANQKTLLEVLTLGQWTVAGQFGCGRNLWAIAQGLAHFERSDPTAAFATVRCLFLGWCQKGWCHPAQAHEWDGVPPGAAPEPKSPIMQENPNHER